MFALIFVIVVAAGVVALVIGVQKNKKKAVEPELHKAADPIDLLPVVTFESFNSGDVLATEEEHQTLAKAKKEIVKAKKPKMAVEKPALKAPKKKASKSKS